MAEHDGPFTMATGQGCRDGRGPSARWALGVRVAKRWCGEPFVEGRVLGQVGVLAPGSWRVVSFVDDRATAEQNKAILDAYHGRLGGPLADLATLVGEVVAVERAPITHETRDGKGTLRIGDVVAAEMEPLCTEERFFPAPVMRRVISLRLGGVTPEEISAGHCVALSRPKELADLLDGQTVAEGEPEQ